MDFMMELLRQTGDALISLLTQPFFYIAIILIILPYLRQTRLERRMFSVRLRAWPRLALRTLVTGIVTGLLVSAAAAFIGVALTPESVYWIWGAAAVLVLIRVHYLCFAYSVGLLGILQWTAGWFDLSSSGEWYGQAAASLAELDIPGLLLLVAIMHGAEALLVRWQGARFASPLFVEGKRGRLVGAYQLQGYWPVPLLLLTSVPAGGADVPLLPWTPLLWPDAASAGWTIAALPMVIGFSALTRSLLPSAKARHSAKGLLYYSIALAAVAAAAAWWQPLMLAAALCALLLHEALIAISRRRESERSPLYVHDERGLRVLAVVPETPAAAMGIEAGEILYKVNGLRVRSIRELHQALHASSAMCKLEVLNNEGESKFVQRARYAGEHHQLGVILAPDDQAAYYVTAAPVSFMALLRRKRAARRRETPTTI